MHLRNYVYFILRVPTFFVMAGLVDAGADQATVGWSVATLLGVAGGERLKVGVFGCCGEVHRRG